jgi:hypothetical protein
MSSIVITTLRGGSALRSWLIALLLIATAPATWAGVTAVLTAPTDGAMVNPVQGIPTSITLQATASANQGYTVSKVEFFHGSTLIGTDTTSPYSFSWTTVPPGSYALTAKATAIKKNSADQTGTSASVNIIVNALPVISMTSPVDEQTTLPIPPPPLTLSATATDTDGTIAKVEFWQDATVIATVTSAPYSFVWNIPPPYEVDGVPKWYVIYAVATDNRGGVTFVQSAKDVTFAPTVALTSPANGTSYAAPATITLNASVSPTDFPIAKMQFYSGTTLIGEDFTSPYSFSWENVGVGSYSLTAVAVESSGPSEWPSSPVNVTVTAASVEPKLHFIHVDHLNSPRLIANAAQQAVWRWDQQEPFGVSPPEKNPSGLGVFEFPLRHPGQYDDPETGSSITTSETAMTRYSGATVNPTQLASVAVSTRTHT